MPYITHNTESPGTPWESSPGLNPYVAYFVPPEVFYGVNLTVAFVVCLQQSLSSQPGLLPSQRFIKRWWANRPVFTKANLLCVETSYQLSLKDLLRFATHGIADTV